MERAEAEAELRPGEGEVVEEEEGTEPAEVEADLNSQYLTSTPSSSRPAWPAGSMGCRIMTSSTVSQV